MVRVALLSLAVFGVALGIVGALTFTVVVLVDLSDGAVL